MTLWRITKRDYAATPLDGEGSRRFGNRWSRPGTSIASTSRALSLAVLEYIVRTDPELMPADLVAIRIEVSESVVPQVVATPELPAHWRDYPAPDELADIGDAWQREGKSLLLCVPSAVVPEETNVLVNPRHPDFTQLQVASVRPFAFDERLFARGR